MAYYNEVAYITKMRPDLMHVAAQELTRVSSYIASVASAGVSAKKSVTWTGGSADRYRQLVTEADELVDIMRDAFKRAAHGVEDYATAVRKAIDLIHEGSACERRLEQLIATAIPERREAPDHVSILRQWPQLRQLPVPVFQRIRAEGDSLYTQAGIHFSTAVKIETTAVSTSSGESEDGEWPGYVAVGPAGGFGDVGAAGQA